MYPELPLQEREISESVQVCMYGLKSVWNAPIIGHPLEGPRAREKRGDFVKSDPVKVLFFLPPWWGHRVLKVMMTQLMLLEEAHRQQAEQGGSRGVRSTPKQKWGGQSPSPCFGAEKHFYGCIWQYLWHWQLQSNCLRQLKNYLRSTKKQDRLKNCLLMHCTNRLRTD